jgi:hypothetical protein
LVVTNSISFSTPTLPLTYGEGSAVGVLTTGAGDLTTGAVAFGVLVYSTITGSTLFCSSFFYFFLAFFL